MPICHAISAQCSTRIGQTEQKTIREACNQFQRVQDGIVEEKPNKKFVFFALIPGDAVDPGPADAGDAPAHAVDDALGAPGRPRQPIAGE